jgi:prolyl oligopeptidase
MKQNLNKNNIKPMKNKVIASLFLCIVLGCKQHGPATCKWSYPKIKPDTAIDVYFGKEIVDPYRNIENIADTAIQDWFLGQRIFFDSIIHHISGRDTLYKEICRLAYSSDIRGSLPRPAGDMLFFKRIYIKEKVEKLFMSDSLTENMAELFSTGSLNRRDSAYYTINYYEPSYNGKYIAFALSSDGDESNVIHILDVEKKILLPERIEQAVSGNPQWLPDGSGFFYKQLQIPPKNNPADFKRLEQSRIRLHILNTGPEKDREIFSKKASPRIPIDNIDFPRFFVFPGSPYVLATLNNGSSKYSELYTCKLDEVLKNSSMAFPWRHIAGKEDKIKEYTIKGSNLFVFSYKSNPNGKLVVIDLENKDKQRILFDHNTMVLSSIIQTKKAIYFTASVNGRDSLFKVNFPDQHITPVNIPLSGTFDLRPSFGIAPYYSNSNYLLFGLNSWDKELGVYYFNESTGTLKKLKYCPAGPYGMPPGLTVKEVEVLAHDGEKIPLTIIHKNNVRLNGKNPTLLYAYGAYGYSLEPYFNITKMAWYNRGGVYAEAHVRGGGEKGDNWYKGGYKTTKPNSWKDFISCAEYLVNNGYTNPEQLAAQGGSAGGITIGRAITERPDLFKAAVIQVGFLNTMRHEFSSNNVSTSEFGSVYDSVEIRYLYEMDTYHHIQEGIKYPAILFTTGMNDPRVAPWDPGKVVAKMQALKNNSNPVLFRISGEGHLGDADSETQTSDIYTFLFWQLGNPEFKLEQGISLTR